MIFHEDTEKLHVNTEPNRNYFLPFPENASPFEEREKSQRFLSLNGTWNFRFYNSFSDIEDDFLETSFSETISVPSNW